MNNKTTVNCPLFKSYRDSTLTNRVRDKPLPTPAEDNKREYPPLARVWGWTSLIRLLPIIFLILLTACTSKEPQLNTEPPISLDNYQIEEGFELQVIASEPLLIAPMVIDFDNQGRIWVLELPGYMANIDGEGEHDPTGRILILNDTDGNGRMDQSQIFLDKLVAPRAMLLTYNGLLYAEPPNLWFVEIDKDKPGKKTLVDSSYVLVGNIEHQANALTMNIDNWIYSARSNARYQRKNGEWVKDQTIHRGQWGLTKDAYGRLFYNDNSNQFQGDLVLPMAALNNPYLKPRHSVRQQIATDQRMYPLHAAVINRGYIEGSLDEEGKPKRITSACGPVIYQGQLFPEEYNGNSFVCLPEGNIVKRNIITYEDEKITATQAYEGKEFIASTDVAFRPVNLYNGPEGAMYIVDLHKGVIQHRAYMSPYLREKIEELQLDTITGLGRLLRVMRKGSNVPVGSRFETSELSDVAASLNHPDVWVRDKAQQFLVQNQMKEAIPLLEEVLGSDQFSIGQIHALWTLDGLDALSYTVLKEVIKKDNPHLSGLAFSFLDKVKVDADVDLLNITRDLTLRKDRILDTYIIAHLARQSKSAIFYQNYRIYSNRYSESEMYVELAVSALSGNEQTYLDYKRIDSVDSSPLWSDKMKEVIENRKEEKINKELLPAKNNPYGDKRQKGLELYRLNCAACHGEDGDGIENLAPPLKGSDYVTGSLDRLGLIVLHGLEGPIHINGERYTFNAAMPGVGSNPNLSDKDILSIIIFLRNAFTTESMNLSEERVKELREMPPPLGSMYTEEMLNAIVE